MAAVGVAPPLIALGPAGWVALGVLGIVSVGVTAVSIYNASKEADETLSNEEPGCTENCPEKGEKDSDLTGEKPKDYPKNPDNLLDDGYEETTHPEAGQHGVRRFKNPKTGDEVEFHKGKTGASGWEGEDHWHRFNPNKSGKEDAMLDENGQPVRKGSNPSHLEPK